MNKYHALKMPRLDSSGGLENDPDERYFAEGRGMGIRERLDGMAHGRRVAVAAASAVLVAGLGVGGAYAATAGLRAQEAESTAKEGKSEAKAPAATTTAAKKASSTSSGSSSGSRSESANKGNSSSGGSSGSNSNGGSSSGSNQQKPAHQHSWSPVYRTETVYTTVDDYGDSPIVRETYKCSACGLIFYTIEAWSTHSDEMWDKGEDHGGVIYGSEVVGYEKKWVGSHQEATGTKQVLDHYECSCGATK